MDGMIQVTLPLFRMQKESRGGKNILHHLVDVQIQQLKKYPDLIQKDTSQPGVVSKVVNDCHKLHIYTYI